MDYGAFAQDWQDAWNSHDLTRILSHYSDHITYPNHRGVLAAETLIFDADGMVVQASACHAPKAKT